MTQTTQTAVFTAMTQAAADALSRVLGTEAVASAPTFLEVVDDEAFADTTAARSMITGGPTPGGLVTVVPAGGIEPLAAGELVDVLAGGAAAALSQELGMPLQAAPSEQLPQGPDVAGLGAYVVRFDVGAGDAGMVPVLWVVEASLAAMIDDDPVTSSDGPSVAPATLPDLDGPAAGSRSGPSRDLHLLAEVPMNVTVELGKAVMRVRDLLSLAEGSVVELDRPAGAPVDVLVNGTLVAHGEVVVIDDELGVRILEVVSRP